jgi:tRNA U34 2-thiouridine synthase MnmA/TrmU
LYCDSLIVNGNNFSWINGNLPEVLDFKNNKENNSKKIDNLDNILICGFKARYQQKIQICKVTKVLNNSNDCGYDLFVQFELPQRAITPGQIIALYDQNGDVCLGGGDITLAGDSYFKQNKELSIDYKNNL